MLGSALVIPRERSFIPGWVLPGAGIDLNFAQSLYYGSNLSSAISCSRNTVAYAQTSAGVLVPFAANVPCITDLGLQVWEGRTNIVLHSQDTTGWTLNNNTNTGNSIAAPDGTTTATLFTDNTTNAAHATYGSNFSLANSAYTFSVYVKAGTLRYISVRGEQIAASSWPWITLDTQSGTIVANADTVASGVTALANGWYRIWLSATMTAQTNTGNMVIASSNVSTAPAINSTLGNAYVGTSQTFYWWGAQVELGSFPSPYIPTTTTSATRAADNITATGALLAAFKGSSGSFIAVTNGQNTIATQTAAQFFGFGSNSGLYYANVGNGQLRVSNSSVTLNDGSITSFIGINKAGLSFDGSGRSIVTNNGTVSSDANSIFTSAISTVFIGSNAAVNSFIDGNIQRLTVFNSRLPDGQLKALTA